jgi:hypothetical protein
MEPDVHCRVDKSPPQVPILKQITPVHILRRCCIKIGREVDHSNSVAQSKNAWNCVPSPYVFSGVMFKQVQERLI